jgi:hypothetical protein
VFLNLTGGLRLLLPFCGLKVIFSALECIYYRLALNSKEDAEITLAEIEKLEMDLRKEFLRNNLLKV